MSKKRAIRNLFCRWLSLCLAIVLTVSLTQFSVFAAGPDPSNTGDFVFEREGNGAVLTAYMGSATEVEVPATATFGSVELPVVAIGDNAFNGYGQTNSSNNQNIVSVEIPDTIIKIGAGAFQRCFKLQKISGFKNVTEFGDNAFNACIGNLFSNGVLADTDIQWEKVTTIGESAFYRQNNLSGCNGLLDLTSVTTLGGRAFAVGTSTEGLITKVIFPDQMTEVPYSIFQYRSGLTSVVLPQNLESIENDAFNSCKITTIQLPSTLRTVGKYAFASNKLTELNLPDGLMTVGEKAFAYLPLVELDIPASVTEIGESSFAGSSKTKTLTKVTLHDGLTSIGNCAFTNTLLKEIAIPNTVTSIGDSAFQNVVTLTTATIGSNDSSKLNSIGDKAFDGTAVTTVNIHACEADVDYNENMLGTNANGGAIQYNFTVKGLPDTISDADDAPTLQEAINAAVESENDTDNEIFIEKNIRLSATVTIPDSITLNTKSNDGKEYTIKAKSDIPLFKVTEEGELTLDGNLTYTADGNRSAIVENNGTLNLKNGILKGVTSSSDSAAVKNFGTFNMSGGQITGCEFIGSRSAHYSAPVVLMSGTMEMTGGSICGNKTDAAPSSGGVLVRDNAAFTMTGGEISGNEAVRGGGVHMLGGTFTLNKDGKISNNLATVSSPDNNIEIAAGGGVFVECFNNVNAIFTMEDGVISDNRVKNGNGGGVAIATEEDVFTMKGGTISGNEAGPETSITGVGGGIYINSKRVELTAGLITENKAASYGGGIGISDRNEWSIDENKWTNSSNKWSTLPNAMKVTLSNVLITGNESSVMGGGIWACPRGTLALGRNGAVFGNTAKGAGDDLAAIMKIHEILSDDHQGEYTGAYSELSESMLGNSFVTYYRDGDTNWVLGNGRGSINKEAKRFDQKTPGAAVLLNKELKNYDSGYGLKAVVSDASAKAAAASARLLITDNKAPRGGGVGSNGTVIIGGDPYGTRELTVEKQWNHKSNNAHPTSVTVYLMEGDTEIAKVILSAANEWKHTFTELEEGVDYTVREDKVPNYDSNNPVETEDDYWVIKNTYHTSSGGHDPKPPILNTKDHFGYIIGYPVDYFTGEKTDDQTKKPVKPQGNITRAEVATIFFRMLTDEARTEYWSSTNSYTDVPTEAWYNNAVSTLTNAGIIDGYTDGSFRPNGKITRAEFATIAVRFFDSDYNGKDLFPDIDGHWAQDYINQAGDAGIIQGYPDGTFGPQKLITRAEAVTMVNRTLDRHPDQEHFLPDMLVWPDNMDTSKWYYADMQEATNSHEYEMKTNSDGKYEIWTKMLPIRDWEAFEKEWSDAGSATNPGEVVR